MVAPGEPEDVTDLFDGDGEVMLTEIERRFGGEVAEIVRGCSDWIARPGQKKPEPRPRREAYLEHLETADDRVVLASMCDKLHNLRSILADLRQEGDTVWRRFSSGREDQLWYYGRLVDVFPAAIRPACRRAGANIRVRAQPRWRLTGSTAQ